MPALKENWFDFERFPAAASVRRLAELFENHGCAYWVDSGTLLSVVRERRIDLDDDFDISAFIPESKLGDVVKSVLGSFDRVSVCSFAGYPFKLKIIDTSGITIDLNMFRSSYGVPCCPQKIRPDLWHSAPSFIKSPLRALRAFLHPNLGHTEVELISTTRRYSVASWIVPVRYIGACSQCDVTGLALPEFTSKYLRYRYGNWEVPVSNWRFGRDDGGISHVTPECVEQIGRLSRSMCPA